MQPSWKPNSTSSSFGGCYTNSWITFILGDFWLNFSTFSTVFSHTHTHTSRGKPVWVSPTSTSTIWEADAPEVVGAINISWNVSRSTRGVGREKWHIGMNSLWRLHHENKKINHKDINTQMKSTAYYTCACTYVHTHIAYKNKDWRHPALLDQHKRTGIVSMISTTAKHSHSGSINQTLWLVVIGAPNLLGLPKAMTPPSTSPSPSSPFGSFRSPLPRVW